MRGGSAIAVVFAAAVLACALVGCGRLFFVEVDAGAYAADASMSIPDASGMDVPATDSGASSIDAGRPFDAGPGFDAAVMLVDASVDASAPADAALPGCDPTPVHFAWAPGGGAGIGLAWSGSTFLLVFNDGADTLHARVLDASGAELSPETLISPSAESGAGPPAVVWDGASFAVVWISHADRSVRGRFVHPDGSLDPRPERTLSSNPAPYYRPSVTLGGAGLFVGAIRDVSGGSPVYIELDDAMTSISERPIAAGPSSMYPNEGCPVGVSGGELAAASVDTMVVTPQLSVSTRHFDGTFLSSTALTGRGAPNNSRLGIACRPTNDCAVSWGDAMSNVHLAAFHTPLSVASDYVIAPASPTGGTDIATDGTRYVVVWDDAFAQTVQYAVVDGATPASLTVTTPGTLISAPGRRAIWPAITWVEGRQYAVAWRDETEPGQSFVRICL